MMVAQGGFDKKEEVENPSEVLLNPSDPEATFRYKAGGRHLGYVGNVVEAVGEKSSLVIVYDYQQNTYADNQFMKDYLNEKKDFSDGSFIVADGAYSGEENSRLASEHNLKLVTTNFTGRKPDEIYADFVFTDDGKYLIKCKNNRVPEDCIYDPGNERSVAYFRISDCEGCPYKERCQSRFLKTRVRKEVSWKSVGRAKQLQYMQTEEFSEYAKFRNGVEAIPSLLRRRYHVDKIPVNLYEYWGELLYRSVIDDSRIIINLASKEYSKCIEKYLTPQDRYITIVFCELSGDKLVTKGTYAKMARGEMVRFMAENSIENPEDIKKFDRLGYSFRSDLSSDAEYVFERKKE